AQNQISLSVAGKLAPHLREENAERLLSDCAGKTCREVDEYLVVLKPRPLFESGIRKQGVPSGAPQPIQTAAPEASLAPVPPGPRSPEKPSSLIQPVRPEVYNLRFSANKAFKDKLLRAAAVLAIKNPQKNLAEVLERGLDLILEKKDPQKKLERRRERERKRAEEPTGASKKESSAPRTYDVEKVPATKKRARY